MENLERNSLSSQNIDYMNIEKEFHKLISSQSKEPIFIDKTANKTQIVEILDKPLQIIKEYVKDLFNKSFGFFPYQSEGNCKECSQYLVKILNADLIWGWFTVDEQIEDIDLIVPTNKGMHRTSITNEEDSTQISHWWVEIGDWIIDMTAEQFNKFLNPSSAKYEPIEILNRKEAKAKRYVGEERHPAGLYTEEEFDEDENIDWENDEGEWQKRDQ